MSCLNTRIYYFILDDPRCVAGGQGKIRYYIQPINGINDGPYTYTWTKGTSPTESIIDSGPITIGSYVDLTLTANEYYQFCIQTPSCEDCANRGRLTGECPNKCVLNIDRVSVTAPSCANNNVGSVTYAVNACASANCTNNSNCGPGCTCINGACNPTSSTNFSYTWKRYADGVTPNQAWVSIPAGQNVSFQILPESVYQFCVKDNNTGCVDCAVPGSFPRQICPSPSPTKTPTATPTVTPTNTPTNTVTPSVTPTITPTVTPGLSPSPTPTNTVTPTVTPTESPTPTNTPTNTVTPSVSPTETPTQTPTRTPTKTPTQTPTQTRTQTPTPTVTRTPTKTPTQTRTQTPTPTKTPTQTPAAICTIADNTNIATVLDCTVSQLRVGVQYSDVLIDNCPCCSTNTTILVRYQINNGAWSTLASGNKTGLCFSDTAYPPIDLCTYPVGTVVEFQYSWSINTTNCLTTVTPTFGVSYATYVLTQEDKDACAACMPPSPSPTRTPTQTPTQTSTQTPTPTQTTTVTPTNTTTPTNTATPTATPTVTPTQTPTQTPTNTPGLSATPTPTSTVTPSITPTKTPTNTPTNTVTPTVTPTITPTNTPTNTVTPTRTATNTPTPTITPTKTVTPTRTPTKTPTPTPSNTPPIICPPYGTPTGYFFCDPNVDCQRITEYYTGLSSDGVCTKFFVQGYSQSCCACNNSCDGIECGLNGCGNSCGNCPSGFTCSSGTCCENAGTFIGASCTGCFESTASYANGNCGYYSEVNYSAECFSTELCCPLCPNGCDLDLNCCDCGGAECGVDNCGGSCGTCTPPALCIFGVCQTL